jgi:cell volume regulation protein A
MDDVVARWSHGPVVGDELPRGRLTGSSVFTSRRWDEERDGDPGYPREIDGVEVREHLRTRRETRGALVALTDGRFAVTGPTVAIGGPRQVQSYARRQLARERDDTARAWWQEVIGALAR